VSPYLAEYFNTITNLGFGKQQEVKRVKKE
jgi:hypothetical protein